MSLTSTLAASAAAASSSPCVLVDLTAAGEGDMEVQQEGVHTIDATTDTSGAANTASDDATADAGAVHLGDVIYADDCFIGSVVDVVSTPTPPDAATNAASSGANASAAAADDGGDDDDDISVMEDDLRSPPLCPTTYIFLLFDEICGENAANMDHVEILRHF